MANGKQRIIVNEIPIKNKAKLMKELRSYDKKIEGTDLYKQTAPECIVIELKRCKQPGDFESII